MLIARTDKARKKLNKISSRANKDGYYYKPRIFIEDLLQLDKDDIYITTACVAGFLRDRIGFNEIFLPLYNHFNQSLLLETQAHDDEMQKKQNQLVLELSKKYNLKIIHANDSHYIYPKQSQDRLEYLRGKGITYGDEDDFILDYPDYHTIVERYKKQGILNDSHIRESLENTLLFDECEPIQINKDIKMPTLYPQLTPEERYKKLETIIYNGWNKEKKKIEEIRHSDYINAIDFELDIIKETNDVVHTADYFLLNEKIVDIAINKYEGILTKSGRGSGCSFYINKLLGFTGVDRLAVNVPVYPTRFISKSRLLESRSLPDFDFNTANPEPFIKATKDLLGENGCYWMLAYGTMKESEAFRNTCRNMELEYSEYNEVAKDLSLYKENKKWKDVIKHSEKFVGSIVSASPHPCACIILDKDIEEEIGVIRIGDKICATITSLEADKWKYLKNDYLTVLVVEIISDVFKEIGKEVMDVSELISNLDDRIWKLYKDGITSTLNQTDSDFATSKIIKYKPVCYEELTSFCAAIRPGFASLLDTFINREEYTNGVEALDKLLEHTNHFMIYQESVMQYLVWLGIPEDITYGIIKKIAKKSFTTEEIEELHKQLKSNWINKVGTEKGFSESWQVVENNAKYSFNAVHALCTALDSLYGAYLKVNYPLEYYKVVLDKYKNDIERTTKLTNELSYFNIKLYPAKFRYSKSDYTIDKNTNSIYKGISSIKHISEKLGEQIYELKDNKYKNFFELLKDIKKQASINSRQLDILIKIDFFNEFGNSKYLLECSNIFNELKSGKAKQLTVEKVKKLNVPIDIFNRYSRLSPSGKTYMELNIDGILNEINEYLQCTIKEDFSLIEKIGFQQEYLGYVDTITNKEKDRRKLVVLDMKPIKSRKKNNVWAYSCNTMSLGSGKIATVTIGSYDYDKTPIKPHSIIYARKLEKKNGYWWVVSYDIVKEV